MQKNQLNLKLFWLTIFAITMAFVESAIVVYLRAIYYPDGFEFPLKAITDYKIVIEVLREAATVFMRGRKAGNGLLILCSHSACGIFFIISGLRRS